MPGQLVFDAAFSIEERLGTAMLARQRRAIDVNANRRRQRRGETFRHSETPEFSTFHIVWLNKYNGMQVSVFESF